ncbi:MAG: tetratricopeptide repeat protein, partial [Burkholderiaceae bacterium]
MNQLENAHLTQAETLFFEGNRCMQANNAAGAEECFRRALSLNQNFAEAMTNLGFLREQAGAVVDAEKYYRQALALRPENIQIYLNLGV